MNGKLKNAKKRDSRIIQFITVFMTVCFLAITLSFFAGASDYGKIIYKADQTSQNGYAPTTFQAKQRPAEQSSIFRQASSLPAKYDSRENNLVTAVKDQGDYGACWAFSAMSVSETSLINEYPETFNIQNTDLSEAHLAYFTYSKTVDPLKLTSGDYTKLNASDYLNIGGNLYFATFTLAKWVGAADEKIMPYEEAKPKSKYSASLAYGNNSAVLENAYWISMKD
ncbi:MAG: C1 family peptidase, partial [Acutalibacteraceae bacterium]